MAVTSNWFKFTEYFDEVVAEGLTRSIIGFAPKGRYAGFDEIAAGTGGSGIPILVSHNILAPYSSVLNVVEEKALVITPHGVLLWTNNEIELDIPQNGGSTIKRYLVYIRYSWVASAGGTLPLASFLDATSLTGDANGQVPDPATDTPIGYIFVGPTGTTFNDCTYEAEAIPAFANNPLDVSDLATLSGQNNFENTQSQKLQLLTQADIDVGLAAMVLTTGNIFEYSVAFTDTKVGIHSMIDYHQEGGTLLYVSFMGVTLNGAATLSFVTGGNIIWPNSMLPHNIEEGHTYLFYKRSALEYVCLGSHAATEKRLDIVETLANQNANTLLTKAGLGQHNIFTKLQQWAGEETSTIDSSGAIVVNGDGNEIMFYGDGSDIEVSGIKVGSSYIEKGTLMSVTFMNIGAGSIFVPYPGGDVPGFNIPYIGVGAYKIVELAVYIMQRWRSPDVFPVPYVFHLWPDVLATAGIKSTPVAVTAGSDFDFDGIAAESQLSYRKRLDGVVELFGTIVADYVTGPPNPLVCTLPTTFRPPVARQFMVIHEETAMVVISISSLGAVTLDSTTFDDNDLFDFAITFAID